MQIVGFRREKLNNPLQMGKAIRFKEFPIGEEGK